MNRLIGMLQCRFSAEAFQLLYGNRQWFGEKDCRRLIKPFILGENLLQGSLSVCEGRGGRAGSGGR